MATNTGGVTATTLSKGTMFGPELVSDLVTKVKGKSALAALSAMEPLPFNGKKEFTFAMDSEIDIVAENGKKSNGGITVEPLTIVPIKFEYGARISDEFMYAAEEEQLDILAAFNDGFAKKVASGLDIAAFHGFNPRTSQASSVVGNNCFAKIGVPKTVLTDIDTLEMGIETTVGAVEASDGEVTGIAMSPQGRQELASMRTSTGERLYPELAWGGNPGTINGLQVEVNKTVSADKKTMAIVGDYQNAFKWGYSKEIPLEVIQYGDPDGSGNDLKAYNQVYLRSEIYIGWGILDRNAFGIVAEE